MIFGIHRLLLHGTAMITLLLMGKPISRSRIHESEGREAQKKKGAHPQASTRENNKYASPNIIGGHPRHAEKLQKGANGWLGEEVRYQRESCASFTKCKSRAEEAHLHDILKDRQSRDVFRHGIRGRGGNSSAV